MNEKQASKEALKHPEMVEYCHDNFWHNDCSADCMHFGLCKSLDYTNEYGTFPVYPGFITIGGRVK